jgi:hypothetical protein
MGGVVAEAGISLVGETADFPGARSAVQGQAPHIGLPRARVSLAKIVVG